MIKEILKNQNRKKPVKLRPIKEPKSAGVYYFKQLKILSRSLKKDVNENIMPLLRTTKVSDNMTTDSVSDIIVALDLLVAKYSNIMAFSRETSEKFVEQLNRNNKKRFDNSINQAIGIDLSNMFPQEDINEILAMQISKNAKQIQSIPDQFLNSIQVIVQDGISNGLRYEEIARQIKGIKGISSAYGKLDNRVKTIARNETSSINSMLTDKRYENAGITEVEWRNSGDERVRGNPSGKYPNSGQDHWHLEGKRFDPRVGIRDPKSGQMIKPGIPINCRCISVAVINID